ncbi:protein FAM240C [Saccopteryx bilineata]|uniref:protein FAM240C n=1 Tax=Saccopteryx bilineata TaxID=59482 RepID=UPI00338EE1F5
MSKSYARKHSGWVASGAEELTVFWEKKIQVHTKQLQNEGERIRKSALDRLRGEWARKLEERHRTLQTPLESARRPSFHTRDRTAS